MANRKEPSQVPGTNGKIIVVVMLILGAIGGFILSRYMPRRNPKQTDPGSPFYSAPTDEELKAERAEALKAIRAEEEKANAKMKSEK